MKKILFFCLWITGSAFAGEVEDFNRTYVLLIRGGVEEAMANDQSFTYRAVRRLGVARTHIYGLAPYPEGYRQGLKEVLKGADSSLFLATRPAFHKQFDFDKDGSIDVDQDLSKANIAKGLRRLADLDRKDQGPSQLLIHLTAHGQVDPKKGGWTYLARSLDEEKFFATELDQMVRDYVPSDTQVIFFIHACYSGSFSILRTGPERLVITSADETHVAWMGCLDGQACSYFDRNFFSALGGRDGLNRPVNADYNGDGRVSFREAYFWSKDRYPRKAIKIAPTSGVKFDHWKFIYEKKLFVYIGPYSFQAPHGNMFQFLSNPTPTEFLMQDGDVPQFYADPDQDAILGVVAE